MREKLNSDNSGNGETRALCQRRGRSALISEIRRVGRAAHAYWCIHLRELLYMRGKGQPGGPVELDQYKNCISVPKTSAAKTSFEFGVFGSQGRPRLLF